ncbi:MAG: type II toxin-antitoxin system Phd/YefM family antitoxin [Acidimicrobiales bacterium]
MVEVGVHEAKTNLSRLLRRVAAGEEVVIVRGKERVAKLVPVGNGSPRQLGLDRGRIGVDDNFDEPLPDEVLVAFER